MHLICASPIPTCVRLGCSVHPPTIPIAFTVLLKFRFAVTLLSACNKGAAQFRYSKRIKEGKLSDTDVRVRKGE